MDNAFVQSVVNRLYLNRWPVLGIVYLVLRSLLGVSYALIYGFVLVLFLIRVPVEEMLYLFFALVLVFYVFGQHVEANHYMSFVFGFMLLSLILHAVKSFQKRP